MRRSGTLAWGALTLALAGLATWQWTLPPPADPRLGLAIAGGPATPAPPAAPEPGLRDSSAITERPLFSRTRRLPTPIAPAVAAEAPPPPPPAPLGAGHTLIGITQLDGEAIAILRQTEGGRTLRLRSGERLGEWTLVGVERRRALRFQRGDRQEVMLLQSTAPGRLGVVIDIMERDEEDQDPPEPPEAPGVPLR